jgi:organic hydroperoxide reductase OsmC/OhrA
MMKPEKILYDTEVTATGGRDGKATSVDGLPGIEKSVAEAVVAGAHERCPYSNATRGNIEVKLTVI